MYGIRNHLFTKTKYLWVNQHVSYALNVGTKKNTTLCLSVIPKAVSVGSHNDAQRVTMKETRQEVGSTSRDCSPEKLQIMKHEKPIRSFHAESHCDGCGRFTAHSINVTYENDTTVHNTRICSVCGTRLNYFSPVRIFKLLAAGAIFSLFIIYFAWEKETLLWSVLTAMSSVCTLLLGIRSGICTTESSTRAHVRHVANHLMNVLNLLFGDKCYVAQT